jgi:hypothetical protein
MWRIVLAVATSICILGCASGPETTWTAEARNPDGYWVAIAKSELWSGPGNNYVATTVYLQPIDDPKSQQAVLLFHPDTSVRMKWMTPTHLDVTYIEQNRERVTLEFQVVKTSGIDISVRHLSDLYTAQ